MNEENLITLIRDVSKGDETAFETLYEMTHKTVFQYLYRISNNQHLAEDILIITYTEVWRSAGKFKGHSKVLTWIMGIARNLAMNELRRHKVEEYALNEEIANSPMQFQDATNKEISYILEKALNKLTIEHKEVLDLVFLQGMRYEDISQVIDIPVNTVKTRVFYAKERLKNILNSMGYTKDDLI